ncbi:uncharacterized [Tachysurus ichikawai]
MNVELGNLVHQNESSELSLDSLNTIHSIQLTPHQFHFLWEVTNVFESHTNGDKAHAVHTEPFSHLQIKPFILQRPGRS